MWSADLREIFYARQSRQYVEDTFAGSLPAFVAAFACDEKVIRDMSFENKKEYSRVLLSCATQRHLVFGYPLAFGEIGVKERVKTVLNYKRPTFWIAIAAIAVCILAAICFLTNPKKDLEAGTAETVLEVPELVTEEIHVEKRDVTHDGVADYIVTSMTYHAADMDENTSLEDKIEQQVKYGIVSVKVYEGNSASDTWQEDRLLWSHDYSRVHMGNGQISIVQKNGQDYLLASSLWCGQGIAAWEYEVFSLDAQGEKNVLEERELAFDIDDEQRTADYTEFKDAIKAYYADGVLIVACDADMEQQMIRTQKATYTMQDYYELTFSKYGIEEP